MRALDALDWSRVTGAYGPVTEAPDRLRDLMSASEADRAQGLRFLRGAVIHQSTPFPAVVEVVPFLVEMLVEELAPDPWPLVLFVGQAVHGEFNFRWEPGYKLPRGSKVNRWGRQEPHGLTGVARKRAGQLYAAVQPLASWYARRASGLDPHTVQHATRMLAIYGEREALATFTESSDPATRACGCFGLAFLGDERVAGFLDDADVVVRTVARLGAVRAGLASPQVVLDLGQTPPMTYQELHFISMFDYDAGASLLGAEDPEAWVEPFQARFLGVGSTIPAEEVKRRFPEIPDVLDEAQRRALRSAARNEAMGAVVWLRELGLDLGLANLPALADHQGTVSEAMRAIQAERDAELREAQRLADERGAARRAELAQEAADTVDDELQRLAELRTAGRHAEAEDAFFDMTYTADHWAALALTYLAMQRMEEVMDAVLAGERIDAGHPVLRLARCAVERASGKVETALPYVGGVDSQHFPDVAALAASLG